MVIFPLNIKTKEIFNIVQDKISSNVAEQNNERKLSVEICLTSIFFKSLDFDTEMDSGSIIDEVEEEQNLNKIVEVPEKSASDVIEEESLRYIGGYIAKKFSLKYPHLGEKVQCNGTEKFWIDVMN